MTDAVSPETPKQPPIPGSEARKLVPFRIMRRGKDSVDEDNEVVFADYSPRVLPADVPDEVDEIIVPKDSAPAPVPFEASWSTTGPVTSENLAQAPATSEASEKNRSVTFSPSSSTAPKTGKSEPPA